MIKLILHGGSGESEQSNPYLIEEIQKGLSSNTKILVVPFARKKEDWEQICKKYIERYKDLGKEIEFFCATEDRDRFVRQVNMSEAIFFTGGSEILLREHLADIAFDIFEGKTVFASSAGANIFAEKYYSNDRERIEDGFYRLPLYTICHFDVQKEKYVEDLRRLDEEKKVISLKEGQFVVLFFDKYGKEATPRE